MRARPQTLLRLRPHFIVVDTPDALLICPRDEEQWVKQLVSRLKAEKGEPLV